MNQEQRKFAKAQRRKNRAKKAERKLKNFLDPKKQEERRARRLAKEAEEHARRERMRQAYVAHQRELFRIEEEKREAERQRAREEAHQRTVNEALNLGLSLSEYAELQRARAELLLLLKRVQQKLELEENRRGDGVRPRGILGLMMLLAALAGTGKDFSEDPLAGRRLVW